METTSIFIGAALIAGIIFPGYALLFGGKTRQLLLDYPEKKMEVYRITAIQLILLAGIAVFPLWVDGLDADTIGLGFISQPWWLIGIFAISMVVLWFLNSIKVSPETAIKIAKQNARVQFLMPSSMREYRMTIILSFVAGICEEIIYRGFLLWFLSNYMPLIPAILLANLPFALAHLTSTGVKNTIGAFILALVFTGAFLLTKSLWLPILLHILVDLYSMTLAYKASQVSYANDRN